MKDTQAALRAKADELLQAQSDVARLEDELKTAKARVEAIATHEMPEIMDDAEVSEFTMTDGTKFSIKESTFVNLKVENRAAFYAWCEANGLAGVIKSTIEIPFGVGDVDKADQLIALLGEGVELGEGADGVEKFQAGRTSKVEASTLRKLAKDRLAEGESWPEDLAPASIVKTVQVKAPKKK